MRSTVFKGAKVRLFSLNYIINVNKFIVLLYIAGYLKNMYLCMLVAVIRSIRNTVYNYN